MSTRSLIGIENPDGTITFAYCHWAGYPTGVGNDIVDMGRTEARRLISRGDMSTVGEPYTDRGELFEDNAPKVATNVETYKEALRENGCDYAYFINRHSTWKYITYDGTVRGLKAELRSTERMS